MDDKTSSLIRQAMLDAIGRQRPQPASEAARQQLLISTLRLAGHTVSPASNDPGWSKKGAEAEESIRDDGFALPRGSARPDGSALADSVMRPHEPAPADEPILRDALYRVNDPTRPADEGKIVLQPFIVDDPTRPADYGKLKLLPDIIKNPNLPSLGGLPHPQPFRIHKPDLVFPDAQSDDPSQDLAPDSEADASTADAEEMPADTVGGIPPDADSPGGDTPAVLPIVFDDDSTTSSPPGAPGSTFLPPSPGAPSFSFPRSDDGESSDGGDSPSAGDEEGTGDGPSPAGRRAIIVQPSEIVAERFATAAAEKTLALAQTTVETAVSDLRQEIYVSRAAQNAIFPR